MRRIVGCLLLLAGVVGSAQAHFIFLLPKSGGGADAVFSDDLAPDREELLEKIKHTTWSLVVGDKVTKLKAAKGKDCLQIDGTGKEPAWVTGVTPYGVLEKGKEPFLLTYYSRGLVNAALPRSLDVKRDAKPIADLKLDLVPMLGGKDGPAVQVLWNGKPLEGSEVVLYVPGQKGTTKAASDAKGLVKLPAATASGVYGVRARHIAREKGEKDGKKYSEARSYCTLTFLVAELKTAEKTESPEATKLLAEARAARASWVGMPGFQADVTVNNEGKVSSGKLTVDARGKVTLKLEGPDAVWARAMLSSTVGHRMDDSSTLTTPCAFTADDAPDHPLGRYIKVLNDEHHSSYRIRDRQVIVVNRSMGPTRFTITVLENRLNAEKKFLPASYVVNTWDGKTGALTKSVSHHNTWVRVGSFDLPEVLTIVTAEAGKQVTRTIRLSHHKLAKAD